MPINYERTNLRQAALATAAQLRVGSETKDAYTVLSEAKKYFEFLIQDLDGGSPSPAPGVKEDDIPF